MNSGAELQVAVVGVGLIGRAWTITFARAGRHVRLWDPDVAGRRILSRRCLPISWKTTFSAAGSQQKSLL